MIDNRAYNVDIASDEGIVSGIAFVTTGKYLSISVDEVIPIYTNKNLHPIKKRADCPMEKDYKLGLRRLMLKELSEIKSTVQIEEIVKKYELKVNML